METNVTKPPDVVNIKPGLTREMSESALSYSNNLDGDWYFNSLTQELAYLSEFILSTFYLGWLVSSRKITETARINAVPKQVPEWFRMVIDSGVWKCFFEYFKLEKLCVP